MHKYNRLFFSVLLFLIACKASAPAGIINQDEMINLLTEVHIIDGTMYNVLQVPDTLYKYGTGKYLALFKKYHTDSAQFKKSFKYYANSPEELRTIYDKITENIKRKTDSLTRLNKIQMDKDSKRVTDSLKRTLKKPPVHPVTPVQATKPAPVEHLHPPFKPRKQNALPVE